MLRIVFLSFFLCCCVVHVQGKICRSLRIVNNIRYLESIRNCSQIWGNLEIVLMQRTKNESELDKYVFPELKQISGYMLLYAIDKLTSIGKLFPSLRAIRGRRLMADYALIIFHMEDLVEIGTRNLLFIGRGYVKVDRCPLLCYVRTINWTKLGDNVKLHFSDMNSDGCEPCPLGCGGYCWNSMYCQNLEADKCHEECLGCSKKHSAKHCDACKNFEYNGECVPECPPHTLNHTLSNRCVTEEQCRSNLNQVLRGDWWPFHAECVNDCPGEYEKAYNKDGLRICRFCGDNCTKHCNVTEDLNTMAKLEKLAGCTHIEGSLALRLVDIDPTKIIGDLSVSLGSIRYIRDSLIIGRSGAITSLKFLQKLKVIEGKKLENKHAIFVYGNSNLKKLWNFTDPKFNLTIKNGTIAFHDNPLLCVSEIYQLANLTKINYSDEDVSRFSNGDKAACVKTEIVVDVHVYAHEVFLNWTERTCRGECIGYTVFYSPVEMDENITNFDAKDVCGDNNWNSYFTSETNASLEKLNAYTRYAFYVKTYHQNPDRGSQSDMMYFVTEPDAPGDPEYLRAQAVDSRTIRLGWKRPGQVNGNLSSYVLEVDMEEDQTDLRELRDYCENPMTPEGTKERTIDRDSKLFDGDQLDLLFEKIESSRSHDPLRENPCLCRTKKTPVIDYYKELSIVFNNQKKMDICDEHSLSKYGFDECKDYWYKVVNKSNNGNNTFAVEKRSKHKTLDTPIIIKPNATAHNLTNLKHYTMYVFYFSACNTINGRLKCSGIEQTFERTVQKEDADDIKDVDVEVDDDNVRVTWSEPKDPNSMILAYKIIYNETSTENSVPQITCIPRDDRFNGSEWFLNNLLPGSYSIRVQAVSLAGPGRESQEQLFVIKAPSNNSATIILWVCVTIVTVVIATLGGLYWWKKKHPPITFRDINPEYHGLEYEPDDWEIERSDIELDSDLGHGTFGTVYYGRIKSKNLPCAVKTANEHMSIKDRMEFLNEASVMKAFSNCHHVVRLMGVVSRGEPPLVIVELMERGDLKKYLHRTRDSSHSLTSNEIYRMAVEIADGMAYLAAKKFVHRDLAARNCMVAGDRTVKIGDFGMARDVYETDYYKKGTKGLLPVRWMAPESLADGIFTSDSDVWSYGIVLWEIATLAEQPYQGMSNEQVLQYVVSKGRMDRPSECSDLFYEVMRQCWSWRPIDRPTFWDIVEKLEDHVGDNFKVVSFIHSREGNEHKIIHGRTRAYNAPAISLERDETLFGHYHVSDENITFTVGSAPHRPSYLQSSLSQSRDSRSSPSDFY